MARKAVAELKDEEREVLDKARAVNEKATAENRDVTDAELDEINTFINAADTLRTAWQKQEKLETLNSRIADLGKDGERRSPVSGGGDDKSNKFEWQGMNQGVMGKRVINLHGKHAHADYYNAFEAMLRGDSSYRRSDGTTNDIRSEIESQGGYFIVPQRMAGQIIKNVDDEVFMQRFATVMVVDDARSLGVTVRKQKANTFVWGSELSDATENPEQSLKWGKRSLEPQYMTGSVDISQDFLFYVPGGEGRVLQEIAIDGGEKIEQACLYGTGVGQPLGLMTPSEDGIPTSRDVTEGTTVDTFDFDTLIAMKYAMKPKYIDSSSVVLMMHRAFLKQIALAKSADGAYLWQPSRQQGEPDRILGIRYVSSEWMPQTAGAGKYFAVLADLSWYWIVYAMKEFRMQRLNETRAHLNQFRYIFRTKLDGAPMKAEAVIRGKFAAA